MSDSWRKDHKRYIGVIDEFKAAGWDFSNPDFIRDWNKGYMLLEFSTKYDIENLALAVYLHGVKMGLALAQSQKSN